MNAHLAKIDPRRAAWILVLALAPVLAAVPAAAETVYLEFSNNGLENLGPGWAYEGWLIVDGQAISTGVFTVGSTGMVQPASFAVEAENAAAASTFVLTIEPVPDSDPTPSSIHVLAGDFSQGTAALSAGHPAALGDNFMAAMGSYILNAPSAGGAADFSNGIWWLDPDAGPGPTLSLPTLPAGWVYEGWVASAAGPVSTGRFTDPAMVDSDGPGITGGPYAAPPFPGQDFVVAPIDLTSVYAAALSIEPEPDNGPGPFTFKPLVDGLIDDVGAGVLQSMDNMADGFPTATVSLMEAASTTEIAHLMLDLQGLESLGPDYVYEGWLIVGGAPVSTGTFTVEGNVPSQVYFPTDVSNLGTISAFVLTIEPASDPDPGPSSVHLLGGDVVGGRAALSVSHPAALGTDFSASMGSYILAAPSAGDMGDYRNGIWWLDPNAGPGATLHLPTLPAGWVYEGWVAGQGGAISTGRFTDPANVDSDGTGPDAGSEPGPSFPGQDWVDPALDLTSGFAAVISVEPEPDNSAGPFTLKPLMDPIIDDVGGHVLQPMHLNPTALPSGYAVLAHEATIPAAASVTGVGGALWFSDMDVANDSQQQALVLFQLLQSDQANPMPDTVMLSIGAGGAMRYEDVLVDLFDFVGTGAIRVLSSNDSVRATSRAYAATSVGSYGQGIPAFGRDQAIGFGEIGRLLQLSEGDTFRTNIGFVNAGNSATMVHLELFDSDGMLIATRSVTLGAAEHRQLNRVYPEDVEIGWARVWTSTAGGSFFAYASIIDNGVDDPTFIVAQ